MVSAPGYLSFVPDGSTTPPLQTTIAILGAGFAGLGMAIRLQQEGIRDFLLFERANDIGGTWRDNVYPGCACDVPSHLYSFSFELNPEWSHVFSPQAEIQAYLQDCTDRHGLRDRIHLGAEVVSATFNEDTGHWQLQLGDGRRVVARFLVNGVGALKDPRYPNIPGRDSFAGIAMHSARWDTNADLDGKRIAVIGTGASAIQIVPKLAPQAKQLTVFQRSAPWVNPRNDRAYSAVEKALFRRVPAAMRMHRWRIYGQLEVRHPLVFTRETAVRRVVEWNLKRHIRKQVGDPQLAERITPDYPLGCKRILVSDDWYPALARPNVDVDATAIEEITPGGLRLADGREYEADALIFCTGFTVDEPLGTTTITGLGGQSMHEYWNGRPRAYLGITMAGFPNSFTLLGPNTGLGHNSVVLMIEAQIEYVLQAIRYVRQRPELEWIDVDDSAVERFVAEIDQRSATSVWQSGCTSWYLSSEGFNTALWPDSTVRYFQRTRHFDPGPYRRRRRDQRSRADVDAG